MSKRIIIEMKDGTKHSTKPGSGPNLTTAKGVENRLLFKTYYRWITDEYPPQIESVWVWDVAKVYEEESK